MDKQVTPAPLPAGTVLEGYTVEQSLDAEPNVLRYSARNAAGDRVVLVELFPPDTVVRDGLRVVVRSAEDQEGWQAWIRSFSERTRQLAALTHPGLVRLRHSFIANGTAYCAVDPIGGETLSSVLERDGTMPEPKLRPLLFSLIAALEDAHNVGLLHGDIEPSRIRIQFDGKAILSGFATLVTPIRFKGHTTVNAGTPGYAPPEHLLVQAAEQPSSDIYSLAAIAYRAICGEAPPEARMRGAGAELRPSAQAMRGRYSAALTAAIDAGLAMRAQQRPQTLAQWRQMLESEEGAASAPARPAPKQSSPVVWMAVPAVLAVLAGAYFLTRNGKAPPPAPAPAVAAAPQNAAVDTATLNAAPAPAASLPTPTLDQLAMSMLKRGQKPVHASPSEAAAPASAAANAPRQAVAAGAAPAAAAPGTTATAGKPAPAPTTAPAAPAGGTAPVASKPAEAAAPGAAPAPAANPPAVATDADKSKEQEALQKAAQDEAARQEAAAREAAAKEALAKQAAANEARDRIKKAIARAKAKCDIPAPELSENENLVYENAMAVPGATRLPDGRVRLPDVTLGDGTTARFVIDSQSCAHRIN